MNHLTPLLAVVVSLVASIQTGSQHPQTAPPPSSQPTRPLAPLPRSNQTQTVTNANPKRATDSLSQRVGSEADGAGWMTQLLALISGLFGGFGGVTVWEVVIKPRILRKRVGKVLEIEIGQNLSRIVHARVVKETRGKIRIDLKLSRLGFDAVASELAVLPSEIIEEVVDAYLRFQYLTQMSDRWQEWEVQRSLTEGNAQRKLTAVIDASIVGYDGTMSGALNSAAKAILALCPIVRNRPAAFKTPEEYLAYVEGQTDVTDAEVAPVHPTQGS